jgi:hypothetical protein
LDLLKTDSTERVELTKLLVAIVSDHQKEAKPTSTAGNPALFVMSPAWGCCVPPQRAPSEKRQLRATPARVLSLRRPTRPSHAARRGVGVHPMNGPSELRVQSRCWMTPP